MQCWEFTHIHTMLVLIILPRVNREGWLCFGFASYQFKSTSSKIVCVVGLMAMMADDPEHPDVFLLTDSEHGETWTREREKAKRKWLIQGTVRVWKGCIKIVKWVRRFKLKLKPVSYYFWHLFMLTIQKAKNQTKRSLCFVKLFVFVNFIVVFMRGLVFLSESLSVFLAHLHALNDCNALNDYKFNLKESK